MCLLLPGDKQGAKKRNYTKDVFPKTEINFYVSNHTEPHKENVDVSFTT